MLVQRAVCVGEVGGRLVEETEVRPFDVEADGGDRPLRRREMGEDGGQQPLHRARLRRQSGHAGHRQVRCLRAEQEIGVDIDGAPRYHPSGRRRPESRCSSRPEISVHAKGTRHVLVIGQEDLTHGDRLRRLFGNLAKDCRRVEPDLRPLSGRERDLARGTVVPQDVVQRRLKVGVAEALDHDAIDGRDLAVDGMRAHDPHDRADADRCVECRPEVEFVRRVGSAFGRDHATQRERSIGAR